MTAAATTDIVRTVRNHLDIVDVRMEALFHAINASDCDDVKFHYDRVLRALAKTRKAIRP